MQKIRSHRTAVVASGLLSLAILVGLGVRLDWAVLGVELGRVNLLYLPVFVLLTLATFWVRALRWRHLLPSELAVSRMSLFEATLVGFTATFVLPLRVGEVIRPWFLSRWQPVRFSTGLASIVTERAFDALTLMVMLGLAVGNLEPLPPLISVGAKVVAVLALCILAVLVTAYLGSNKMTRWAEQLIVFVIGKRYPKLADRLVMMIEGFLSGLRGVSSLRDLGWVVLWSATLWGLLALLYQVGLWSFGVDASLWVGVTVCVMIALAVAAPGAPGFVGTFQLGCVIGLSIFGYPDEFSIAYSIVLHSLQAVTVVVSGFFILHRRGLHMIDLKRQVQAEN